MFRSYPWGSRVNTFEMDAYVLNLYGCNVVLGVQWLRHLGPTLCDFSQLTMQFEEKDNQIYQPKRNAHVQPTTRKCG